MLASRLANGVDQILGKDTAARRRVIVSNLHAYAHSLLVDSGRKFEILKRDQLSELLAKHRKQLDRDKFSDDFIEAEWNAVIDYWGIDSWEEYEKVSRAGRGTALPVQFRRQLWQAFSQVRAELKRNNLLSWGDLCDEARSLVELNGTRPFRHVIVDELSGSRPARTSFRRITGSARTSVTFLCWRHGSADLSISIFLALRGHRRARSVSAPKGKLPHE